MNIKKHNFQEKSIIMAIPLLFLFGSLIHFLYDFSNSNLIIGLFTPINESIWEHSKMVLLPIILWWSIYYIITNNKNPIDKHKWFSGALASLIVALITIPLLYYFYTEAFAIKSLFIDILLLFISLSLGQLMGLHFYKHSKGIPLFISIIIFILLIIIFILFTFCPPNFPIFKS